MAFLQLITLFFVALLLSACVPKIDRQSPMNTADLKEEFSNLHVDNNSSLSSRWWRVYGDAQLDTLIEKALLNAPSIKSIEARYAQANSIIAAAQAGNMPSLTLNTDLTRERFSENYIFPPPLGGGTESLYQVNVGLNYDFDFFNARRSKILSAKYAAMAQKAYIDAMRLMLSSAICKLYLSWDDDEKTIKLLMQIKSALKEENLILHVKHESGLINETQINTNSSNIFMIDQHIQAQLRMIESKKESIGILGGFMPSYIQTLRAPLIKEGVEVELPKEISLDLIGHRADVAVQKYTLFSKEQNIQNAKAQFYPNISLNALLGFTSFDLSKFIDNSSYAPVAGVAASLPIFDGGARKANLSIKVSDYNSSVNEYNNAIIKAVNEVVGVMKKQKTVTTQSDFLEDELRAKERNIAIEKQRYDAGLSDKLPLIEAKLERYKTDIAVVELEGIKSALQVDLMQALGGGYQEGKTDASR